MSRIAIISLIVLTSVCPLNAAHFELIESGDRTQQDPFFSGAIFTGLWNLSGDGFHVATINYCCPVCDCGLINYSLDLQTSELQSTELDQLTSFSYDGETVLGSDYRNSAYHAAAHVDDELKYIDDGSPDSRRDSFAWAISNDNSTIVGQYNERPVAWTDTGRMLLSRDFGKAVDVSADGSAAIINGPDAKRWTQEGVEELQPPVGYTSANAVNISTDGSIVSGYMRRVLGPNQGFEQRAFRWTSETGMVDIGEFVPRQTSDDGNVIVGESTIWFSDRGTVTFNDLIFEQTGRRFDEPLEVGGVSADGRSFVGAIGGVDYGTTSIVLRLGDFEDCDLNGDHSCDVVDIDAMAFGENTHVFRTTFDLNIDDEADFVDREIWVEQRMNTYFGDANLDGEFNSSDLTRIFQSNRYAEELSDPLGHLMNPVSWSEGDWNGDLRFDSRDLILAFRKSTFDGGIRPFQNVPEPASWCFRLALFWFAFFINRRYLRKSLA